MILYRNYFAGIGNDPRDHRFFKTVTQGMTYDEDGDFIATWIPELRDLPAELRHKPWECQSCGLPPVIGYPGPIIEPQGQVGMVKKRAKKRV